MCWCVGLHTSGINWEMHGCKIWHPRNLTVVYNPATVLLPCCLCEDLLFVFLSVLYIFMCMCSVLGEGSIFIMMVLAAYYWYNLDFVWMYKFSEYSGILFSRAIWVIETFTKICWWKLRMQLNWKKNHTLSDPSKECHHIYASSVLCSVHIIWLLDYSIYTACPLPSFSEYIVEEYVPVSTTTFFPLPKFLQ